MKLSRLLLPLLALGAFSLHCAAAELNQLTAGEKAAGWKLLFDGKSFTDWREYNRPMFRAEGWSIDDGCLKNGKGNGRPGSSGGDIVTVEHFADFDFRFEWKIVPGGNSGVKYFINEQRDRNAAIGHEYQLLDDAEHPDGKNGPIRQTGALYSLIPPNGGKKLRPVGQFNESRIVVQGKHVEHWLNGTKIVEYELESQPLLAAIAKSKYKSVPGFGTKFKTSILLQDHGFEVWFRNLKIRLLAAPINN